MHLTPKTRKELAETVDAARERFETLAPMARAAERVGHDMRNVMEDQLDRISAACASLDSACAALELGKAFDELAANSLDDDSETLHAVFVKFAEAVYAWEDGSQTGAVASWARALAGEGASRCRKIDRAVDSAGLTDRRVANEPSFKGPEKRKSQRRKKERNS